MSAWQAIRPTMAERPRVRDGARLHRLMSGERTRYYQVRPRRVPPEFRTDELLEDCSILAALLLYRLVSLADDQGRLPGHPKSVRANAFPLRPGISQRRSRWPSTTSCVRGSSSSTTLAAAGISRSPVGLTCKASGASAGPTRPDIRHLPAGRTTGSMRAMPARCAQLTRTMLAMCLPHSRPRPRPLPAPHPRVH
jgi:hypothetical protein